MYVCIYLREELILSNIAMGEEVRNHQQVPLLDSKIPHINRTGTLWTAVAHIITGVLGSGVLSLGWSLAQLGWIAGPLAMLVFATITLVSTYLLCNCYKSPDPEHGPTRNRSYMEAAQVNLGETSTWVCGLFVHLSFYGFGIAYTITSAISMSAIQKTNCHHKYGHGASCEFGDTIYILIFGASQVLVSQIPNFHNIEWLSIVAAIMSFAYSIIAAGLALAKVIGNGVIKGSTYGITASAAKKTWLVSQAIGDVAFAFPFAIILIEIQDTLKSPPAENETMKKASTVAITITTFFYLCCGAFGYAAFGDSTPGNLLTGFDGPFWLVDFANVCIVLHLIGGYQVYSQPVFAMADKWFAQKYPNNSFVTHEYTLKLPILPAFKLNLLRLCFRTAYVASTTLISMLFPYFNQVLGVLGAINFWSLSIYFPVKMYVAQRKIGAWTTKWIVLRVFSFCCLVVTIFALIGSLEGLITAKIG